MFLNYFNNYIKNNFKILIKFILIYFQIKNINITTFGHYY